MDGPGSLRDPHPEGLASICAKLNVDKSSAHLNRERHDARSFQRARDRQSAGGRSRFRHYQQRDCDRRRRRFAAPGAVSGCRERRGVRDLPLDSVFRGGRETGGTDSAVAVGNEAIRRYLAAAGNGRLVQSLKSFLADKSFESTDIMGETYRLGDLIAPIISALRDAAIAQFGELPPRIVVGYPVSSGRRQSGRGARAQPARHRSAARRMDRRCVRVRAGWRGVRLCAANYARRDGADSGLRRWHE